MSRTPVGAAAVLVLVLAACAPSGVPDADGGDSSASRPSSSDAPAGDGDLLADHGLAGLDAHAAVDRLEALDLDERPAGLAASIRVDELLLSDDAGREQSLPLPDDLFYLALAPYVDASHDCFYHAPVKCQGELAEADVHVTITDADGAVLVDEETTTHPNGFVSYWLPRGSSGTVEVTADGRTGRYAYTTDAEAPTCVTTLQLT